MVAKPEARIASRAFAGEPGAHYVLVSTRDPDSVEFRSFRITGGAVTEEEVRVVETLS